MWFFPWYNPNDIFTRNISWIDNFVISGPDFVMVDACKSNLIRFLFYELAILIFFVSENAQMAWNWRWIHNS